jgi:hypothetical protein
MQEIKINTEILGYKIETYGKNGFLRLFDENKNELFNFNANNVTSESCIALLHFIKYQNKSPWANFVKNNLLDNNH